MTDKKLELLTRRLLEAQQAYDYHVSMRDVCYNNWREHNSDGEDEDLAYYCERFLEWWYIQPKSGE
jgi:hypothetical protein